MCIRDSHIAKTGNEGEEVGIRNLGEQILNPEVDKNKKEINSNSWIYNTASRFQIKSPYNSSNKSTPVLLSDVDRSQLKKGDNVEILIRGEQTTQATAIVDNINGKQVNLGSIPNSFVPAFGQLYDCLLYTSPSPRDRTRSRMPSSA